MKTTHFFPAGFVAFSLGLLVLAGCTPMGSLEDRADGRKPEDFPELAADVFKPMDGGIALAADEIKGRNTWNLWCGGDEQFWERMARESFGLIDLLKTIDSRKRGTRFKDLGLINQPGYKQATKPDKYGLWLDEAVEPEPSAIEPKVYGHATGIMGFRLFENPDFKGDAVKQWNAERYYNDADYAVKSDLIRPYKVGISCGSCHIAFHPCKPPDDPENPKWENLASAIGNQYIREVIFAHNVKPGGFFWEMLKTQPPGTSDTSRIATDNLNNPNAINPIFELGSRLAVAEEETLAGDTLNLPTVTAKMKVPHVLKDGADSVGVPGATLRVYINIGSYSQHWLQQHNALVGLRRQQPFSIKTAQEHSVYWLATQTKFPNIARFFMRLKSYRLEDAPGGKELITKDEEQMKRGRLVFAENCAKCHSSKRPPPGKDEDDFFREEVLKPDFRDNNFFSDDRRYPLTKIKSNAGRACGTNAKRGHIWDAFSSETYKNLPPIGDIEVWNPYTDQMEKFTVPGGGPGYYRTPSLISVWSSAPFLHNNALGKFTGDPSVAGRLEAFNDAIEKLLWPGKRLDKASIWRTSQECSLQIQASVLPEPLRGLLKLANQIDADGYFRLGLVPQGTPINLLANINPDTDPAELVALCLKIKKAMLEIKLKNLDSAAAKELLKADVAPALFRVSKCPDLVEDRGHYFGTELPDPDKRALIEFIKTVKNFNQPETQRPAPAPVAGQTERKNIMPTTVKALLKMSKVQLDELFKNSLAGPIPDGEAKGTAIIAPGSEVTGVAAQLIHFFTWQGKVFDSKLGILRNKILPLGHKAIVAKVYKDKSWFDGNECIVLDYSETSLLAKWVRDEIRQVGPNTYLGIVYWRKTKTIDFALEFPK